MVGRRDTGHRGQGDVRHGSHFKDMHKTLMNTWPHAWVPTPPKKDAPAGLLHVGPKKLAWRRARVSLTRSAAGPAALQAEPVAPWLAPMARSTDTVTDWLLCAGSGTSSMICCESR